MKTSVMLPQERHLETPEVFIVDGTETVIPSVLATAVAVYAGWLVLWRYEIPVAVFRPGHWTGVWAKAGGKVESRH